MANTTTNVSGNQLTGAPTLVRIPPNYPVEPQPGKLEDLLRYNEKAIYHKYNPYTENTNLLKFGREQPYIYTYIDEKNKPILPPIPRRSSILQSQAIPIEPGTTDLVRITRYLTSGRGVEFLTKQLLLQAQQPFDETGIYNPLEVPLALASSTTLGVIPRPVRHVNISGGVLGALASLIGISISNGNTAPPSSVGQGALPTFGSGDGKGLLRATTANKAKGILYQKWPDAGPPNSLKKSFFSKLLKSVVSTAVDTIKAFLPKILTGGRQRGFRYRSDEFTSDRMRADGAGRLKSFNKAGADVPINDLRREAIKVLNNNKVYRALNINSSLFQYHPEQPYLKEYEDSTSKVSVVDTSIITNGVSTIRNYRLVRAGAGDGLNQLGVLDKRQPNSPGSMGGVPIKNAPEAYTGWEQWMPYQDDLIAFFFYDVVNEKYIPFRATVKGINDTTTAYWDELRFIGRADQIYTYNGFARSLAFQFSVVITSLADMWPTWQKLNYIKTSLKPAGYTVSGDKVFNRFMIPPMFMLTIGDMYKWQPIVITSITVNVPENAGWETLNENNVTMWEYLHDSIRTVADYQGKFGQLPKEVDVSIACNLLEKERAVVGGVDFGHAPRDENGQLIDGVYGKPYMPEPTRFSKRMLVDVKKYASQPKQANAGTGVPPAPAPTQMNPISSPDKSGGITVHPPLELKGGDTGPVRTSPPPRPPSYQVEDFEPKG